MLANAREHVQLRPTEPHRTDGKIWRPSPEIRLGKCSEQDVCLSTLGRRNPRLYPTFPPKGGESSLAFCTIRLRPMKTHELEAFNDLPLTMAPPRISAGESLQTLVGRHIPSTVDSYHFFSISCRASLAPGGGGVVHAMYKVD